MKQISSTVVCFCLVFAMLAASFGSARAANNSLDLPDPTTHYVSGNPEFKVKTIGTANLPGVTHTDSGMLIPAGFPVGEKQFEGNGIQISNLDGGSVKACFPFTGTQYGWGGQVGKWNGSKWLLLPTSTTTPAESRISYACTTVSSDGDYTFLKWVIDPSKIPVAKSVCGYNFDGVDFNSISDTETADRHTLTINNFSVYYNGSQDLEGEAITLSIKNVNPAGAVIMEPVTGILHKVAVDQYDFSPSSPVQMVIMRSSIEDEYEYWTVLWMIDLSYCEDTTEGYFFY